MEGQTILTENLTVKLQYWNQNSCLSVVSVIGQQPGPGAPLLGLVKSIYY